MANNYVIFPELEDQIKSSGLINDYPDLEDYLWIDGEVNNSEINSAFQCASKEIRNEIGRGWNKAIQKNAAWELKGGVTLPRTGNDLLLATGDFLYGTEIPDEVFLDYEKYGFSSVLEMIMSLSAYRVSEEGYEGIRECHSWTLDGIKNIIGYGGNSETNLFQADEKVGEVISPFGNVVKFKPRNIKSVNRIYNGSEDLRLFGIVLRYAYELGILKDIFVNGELPLVDELRRILKDDLRKSNQSLHYPFSMTLQDAKGFIQTSFGEGTHGVPYLTGNEGSYIVSKKGSELVFSSNVHGELTNDIMGFGPKDCRDLLKGLFLGFYYRETEFKEILLDLIDDSLAL